jgi:hypothetical protein
LTQHGTNEFSTTKHTRKNESAFRQK